MSLLPVSQGVKVLFGVKLPLRTFINKERYLFDQIAEQRGLEKAQRDYQAAIGKGGLESVSQKIMNQAERLDALEKRRTRLNDELAEDFDSYDENVQRLEKLEALIETESKKLLELRQEHVNTELDIIKTQEQATETFLELAEAVQSEFVYRLVTEVRGETFKDGDTPLGTLSAFRAALNREHIGVAAEVVEAGKPSRLPAVKLVLEALKSEDKLTRVMQLLALPEAELAKLAMMYAGMKQREASAPRAPTGKRFTN